jgi:hypothetical protein
MNLDPSNKRLLALLSAPLFLVLKDKLGLELTPEVQELLIASVMTYILGSHTKEAIVKRAEALGSAAAATVVTPSDAAKALADPAVKP